MANRVTGQSVAAAAAVGLVGGALLLGFARPIIAVTQLQGDAGPWP